MIKFEQVNNQKVNILFNKKIVGHIFTPSGTGEDKPNCIQICGFDEAFDLWGCGVFGEKEYIKVPYTKQQKENLRKIKDKFFQAEAKRGYYMHTNVKAKKDIQLLFSEYDKETPTHVSITEDCLKCYNKPCNCKDLAVKREKELKGKIIYSKE